MPGVALALADISSSRTLFFQVFADELPSDFRGNVSMGQLGVPLQLVVTAVDWQGVPQANVRLDYWWDPVLLAGTEGTSVFYLA